MASKLLRVGILLFLMATVSALDDDEVQGDEKIVDPKPYLDEDGNLCQDKLETMQDLEYDTMIQCSVSMTKKCENQPVQDPGNNEEEEEACHTVYEKKCKTVMRPHSSKVRVRVCPDGKMNIAKSPFGYNNDKSLENIVLDVRPTPNVGEVRQKCIRGRRTVCNTKFSTECITEQIQQTMVEDYPKCQVEMVEKCAENDIRTSECSRVPAMRCKIEKRTVVKTKPESRCSRVPREYCRKENCKDEEEQSELMSGDPNCYYRNQIVNEIVPEEKCTLIPKQMCHSVTAESADARLVKRSADDSWDVIRRHYLSRNTGMQVRRKSRNFEKVEETTTTKPVSMVCQMVPEQKCEKKRVNPRPVEKKMTKKFCRQPRKDSFLDQFLLARLKKDP